MGRRTSSLVVTSMALVWGATTGCSRGGSTAQPPATTTPIASTARPTGPVPLSVLVFNVEYGGTRATDAVMADVHADVVGVPESYNRLPEIAAAAGSSPAPSPQSTGRR